MRYVRLLVQTNWEGRRLKYGEELYVPEAVAIRWERNRIAEVLDSEPSQPDPSTPSAEAFFPAVLPATIPPHEDVEADPNAKPVYTVERVGTSSWHDLLKDGEVVERINGEGNAWKRARELSDLE